MLFGVFEKARFQIRYLQDVLSYREDAKTYRISAVKKSAKPWRFENLKPDQQIERLAYSKSFDLDIVQSQVSNDPIFGTAGGAQVAFTDILGNDQYHMLIYNNARTSAEFLKSFSFAVTRVSLEKRMNYAYGLFRYVGRNFNYDDLFYYEDRAGGFMALRILVELQLFRQGVFEQTALGIPHIEFYFRRQR